MSPPSSALSVHSAAKNRSPDRETGRTGFSRKKAQESQKRRSRLGDDSSSKTGTNPARSFISTPCAPYGVPCFCSVVRIVRSGGDGPIRPTLQKRTNATERARSSDNNIGTEKSGRQNRSGPESSDTAHATEAGLQICSVGRIGPSPPHLFESARIHSHPLLTTPVGGGFANLALTRRILHGEGFRWPGSPIITMEASVTLSIASR